MRHKIPKLTVVLVMIVASAFTTRCQPYLQLLLLNAGDRVVTVRYRALDLDIPPNRFESGCPKLTRSNTPNRYLWSDRGSDNLRYLPNDDFHYDEDTCELLVPVGPGIVLFLGNGGYGENMEALGPLRIESTYGAITFEGYELRSRFKRFKTGTFLFKYKPPRQQALISFAPGRGPGFA